MEYIKNNNIFTLINSEKEEYPVRVDLDGIDTLVFDGGKAFWLFKEINTDYIKKIIFKKDVTAIEGFVFFNGLQEIIFEEGSKCKEIKGFRNINNVKELKIPKSVNEIDGFNSGKNVERIIFEEGSRCYSLSGFQWFEKLKTITIPASVEKIEGFYKCGLEELKFEEGSKCEVIDGFSENKNLKEIIIPDSVNIIRSDGFKDCTNLEKVAFGEGKEHCKILHGFSGCNKLKEIMIPKTTEHVIGFKDCTGLEKYEFEKGGICNFLQINGCTKLKEIIIPKNVKAINGFDNLTSLEKIDFEEGTTCETFANLTNIKKLKKLFIPKTVNYFGNINKFDSLKEIIFEKGSQCKRFFFDFKYCPKLKEITLPKNIFNINIVKEMSFLNEIQDDNRGYTPIKVKFEEGSEFINHYFDEFERTLFFIRNGFDVYFFGRNFTKKISLGGYTKHHFFGKSILG